MTQALVNLYVDEELRRLERERPSKEAEHRLAWLLSEVRAPTRRRRAAARWLGDRLVAAGERLCSWSAIEMGSPGRPAGSHRLSDGGR